MLRTSKFGPFTYRRLKERKTAKHFIDISLTRYRDEPFGWVWGNDQSNYEPHINIRVFGLDLLYFEKFSDGFHISILGFWYIHYA